MIEIQDVNIHTPKGIESTSSAPKTLASNDMLTEILLTLTSKESGKQQIFNCLIDTGCSKGLICETLVSLKEFLNKQVMNWKTNSTR
jgi:hypothetical protein